MYSEAVRKFSKSIMVRREGMMVWRSLRSTEWGGCWRWLGWA